MSDNIKHKDTETRRNQFIIADSGSTKTDWCVVSSEGRVQTCTTGGINPFFMEEGEVIALLQNEFSVPFLNIEAVYFYGAGCIPEKAEVIAKPLSQFFGTKLVEVNTDLLAAARSLCQHEAGVACILGTGSNSCYYNGNAIEQNISPLGFILGDEGSGAVLGKKLLADILKKQLSRSIREDFFATYRLTPAEILDFVYRKPFPNRYLAQFTKFISKHIEETEISLLVETSFREFISRNLLQYECVRELPVHFTGSVAYYFKEQLGKALQDAGLRIGRIEQSPMPGLITYHLQPTT